MITLLQDVIWLSFASLNTAIHLGPAYMRYGGLISDLVQEEEKTSMFGNILSFKSPDTVCTVNM